MFTVSRILRVVQAFFALIVMSLSAYVAHWYNADIMAASPSQINFLIFGALWTFISIAYLELGPQLKPKFAPFYALLAIEFVNVLFWFAGFVALAVFLSGLLFCRGAVCSAAQADIVFSSFLFAAWSATAGLRARDALKSGFRRPSPVVKPDMKETLA